MDNKKDDEACEKAFAVAVSGTYKLSFQLGFSAGLAHERKLQVKLKHDECGNYWSAHQCPRMVSDLCDAIEKQAERMKAAEAVVKAARAVTSNQPDAEHRLCLAIRDFDRTKSEEPQPEEA